jgi:short-subunit dehydrogenase involved in D-alanine esterification of teichoic acids
MSTYLQLGFIKNLVSPTAAIIIMASCMPLTAMPPKSAHPKNQVFAIIRSRATAGPLEELAAKRNNIHIVVTDLSDPMKLGQAATEVSKVTAGSLDVLILNAGSAGPETSALTPTALSVNDSIRLPGSYC